MKIEGLYLLQETSKTISVSMLNTTPVAPEMLPATNLWKANKEISCYQINIEIIINCYRTNKDTACQPTKHSTRIHQTS